MARSKATTAVLGCLGITVAGTAVTCCGGGLVLTIVALFFPSMMLGMMTEPQPLAVTVPPADPVRSAEARRQISEAMVDPTKTAHVAPQDLVNELWTDHTKVPVASMQVDAQQALVMDLSVQLDPGSYLNFHARTPTFVISHGWFDQLTCDELVLSGWNMSDMMKGQDLAMNVNRSLADQRRDSPDLDAFLKTIASLKLANGGFDVQFEPGTVPPPGWELPPPTVPAPTDPNAPVVPADPTATPATLPPTVPPPSVPPAQPVVPAG